MGFNTFPCNPYPISTEELNKGNNDDLNTRVAVLESDVSDLNSNKANQITIAPFFNEETAYTAGDLVYYNGLTYRCTNDHEGEWDADDFAATTVAGELATLKSGLTDVNSNINSLLTYSDLSITDGTYKIDTMGWKFIPDVTGYKPIGCYFTGGTNVDQYITALSSDSIVRFFTGGNYALAGATLRIIYAKLPPQS